MKIKILAALVFLVSTCTAQTAINYNQSNLAKRVTIELKGQKINQVLQRIGEAGGFYFTYNGALFVQDSIVNLNVRNLPVREVLDELFGDKVDYKENAEYIILRSAVNHFVIEAENIITAENLYAITGRVIDTQTGNSVKNASVYEKRLLQSTLTDEEGFFSLRFKGSHEAIVLTASKESYRDTSIVFLSSISIKPQVYDDPNKDKGTFMSSFIDNLKIGRLLTSSKQRLQHLNVPSFLTNLPVQASLVPGLSSHGNMSGNVVNNLSLNFIGGYTAGVDGAELAGVFNLNKADVKYVQLSGMLNMVGGHTDGMQVAGMFNMVGRDAHGIQIAGVYNHVRGKVGGTQIAGVANVSTENLKGIQIAGVFNTALKDARSFQLSGVANANTGKMKGVQLSGIINYARVNKGFQIGLINVADTSSGASLGLVNLIRRGYHKITLSTNDMINTNIAFKGGNANLYTLILLGKNFKYNERIETFGFGLGHDFFADHRVSVCIELSSQQLHLGRWDYANILTKFQPNLQCRLSRGLSIFGGPVFNYYVSNAPADYAPAKGYQSQIAPSHSKLIKGHSGWLGWCLGVNMF